MSQSLMGSERLDLISGYARHRFDLRLDCRTCKRVAVLSWRKLTDLCQATTGAGHGCGRGQAQMLGVWIARRAMWTIVCQRARLAWTFTEWRMDFHPQPWWLLEAVKRAAVGTNLSD